MIREPPLGGRYDKHDDTPSTMMSDALYHDTTTAQNHSLSWHYVHLSSGETLNESEEVT